MARAETLVLCMPAGRRRRVGGGISGHWCCHALQVSQCDLHLHQSLPAWGHAAGLRGGHLRPTHTPLWSGQSQGDCVRACLCVGLAHTRRSSCRAAQVIPEHCMLHVTTGSIACCVLFQGALHVVTPASIACCLSLQHRLLLLLEDGSSKQCSKAVANYTPGKVVNATGGHLVRCCPTGLRRCNTGPSPLINTCRLYEQWAFSDRKVATIWLDHFPCNGFI